MCPAKNDTSVETWKATGGRPRTAKEAESLPSASQRNSELLRDRAMVPGFARAQDASARSFAACSSSSCTLNHVLGSLMWFRLHSGARNVYFCIANLPSPRIKEGSL